jgi:hypothetical protein
MTDRIVRIVKRGTLPPGLTGRPWPRRMGHRGHGYNGHTISLRWFGIFVGKRDTTPATEGPHAA